MIYYQSDEDLQLYRFFKRKAGAEKSAIYSFVVRKRPEELAVMVNYTYDKTWEEMKNRCSIAKTKEFRSLIKNMFTLRVSVDD